MSRRRRKAELVHEGIAVTYFPLLLRSHQEQAKTFSAGRKRVAEFWTCREQLPSAIGLIIGFVKLCLDGMAIFMAPAFCLDTRAVALTQIPLPRRLVWDCSGKRIYKLPRKSKTTPVCS